LADADFVSNHIRDTIIVQLIGVNGPNSGFYRNYNEVNGEFANVRITSTNEYKAIRTSDMITAGRSGFILVMSKDITIGKDESDDDTSQWSDVIAIRALIPEFPGDTTNIYSSEFRPVVSPQKKLALQVQQTDMELVSLRLYESSEYNRELVINERSFEGDLDKIYVRARVEDPGHHAHILYNEMRVRIRNLTRNYADGSNPNPTIGDGRGPDYIDIKLIETGHNTNIYLTDPQAFAQPVAKVITKQFPDDFASRTNQDDGELYCERGDTIQFVDLDKMFAIVDDYPPPVTISEFRRPNPYRILRTNASYNQIVTANYLVEEVVHFRVLSDFYAGYPSYASNPLLRDKMTLTVENLATGDSIILELYETEPRAEDYRIDPSMTPYFRITNFTSQAAYDLKGTPGDTIYVWAERRVPKDLNFPEAGGWDTVIVADTRIVARQTEPQNIQYIEIKNDASYTINLPTDQGVVWGQTIHVQLIADPGDPALIDQTWVNVVRGGDQTDTITLKVVQSALGSPFYRGTFTISQFTNDQLNEIGVVHGETLYVQHHIQHDKKSPELFVTPPQPPTNVNLTFFTTSSYMERMIHHNGGFVLPNDQLFIKLTGNDPNPNIADEAIVKIESFSNEVLESGPPYRAQGTITAKLTETGLSSGEYRGTITIGESSDTFRQTIRGFFGDMIKVSSLTHPNRYDTVTIPMPMEPQYITDLYIKDSNYELNLKGTTFTYSDILYIEAWGHFGNPFIKDTTLVQIIAIDNAGLPIPDAAVYSELIETNENSGIFRGKVQIANNEYLPNEEQTVFYNPFYDQKLAPSFQEEETNKNLTNIKEPKIEIPVLGNLKGFSSIKILWPVDAPSPQVTVEYNIVRAEPGSVYPNPWRSDEHSGKRIRFENLAANSEIKIYDIQGHLITKDIVIEWQPAQGYERYYYDWDLTNISNSKVASGIYIYIVRDRFNSVIQGKLGIIR
jgi:hypothetical protein